MIYGYNRIPIVSWMQGQADESLAHARRAGEMITHFGEHPSLSIGPLLETHKHDIGDILRESMEHERGSLETYKELLARTIHECAVDRDFLVLAGRHGEESRGFAFDTLK